MVATLSLSWDEECQYSVELSKDMEILLFSLNNSAKGKRKLFLQIKEKEEMFYVIF